MLNHVMFAVLTLPLTAGAPLEERPARDVLAESFGGLLGTWEQAEPARPSAATRMSFRWAAGQQAILWEGSYPTDEADWSFVAVFFFDPVKGRLRVFAFNSEGQRHMGILADSTPGKLAWNMSGLRDDGSKERFVAEFVKEGDGVLIFNLRDRRPADEAMDGDAAVMLRRVVASEQGPQQ
jgi:hypothetical protein